MDNSKFEELMNKVVSQESRVHGILAIFFKKDKILCFGLMTRYSRLC